MTWIDGLTVAIVIVFILIVLYFYLKDFKRNLTKYTSFLVFKEYNKRIEKLQKKFTDERMIESLSASKLSVIESDKPNDSMIFDNIKVIDAVEDNLELLKSIKKEVSHLGGVASRVGLLKRGLELVNLENFVATPKTRKHKAINEFKDKLNEVVLEDQYKKVLSATPCYKFGNVFMFLPDKILKIDMENIFAAEILDYSDIAIKIWKSDEGYLDFDGTYELDKTVHKLPDGAQEGDLSQKELVFAKTYVLSFTYKEITFDVEKTEMLTERQKVFDKLVETNF